MVPNAPNAPMASSTSCARPSIHHTAFPHIMDAICSHASHSSLLALRSASRSWRSQIDRKLHAHVAIAPNLIPWSVGSGTLPFQGHYACTIGTLDLVHLGPPGWAPSPSPLSERVGSLPTSRTTSPVASPSTSSYFPSYALSATATKSPSFSSPATSPLSPPISRVSPIRARPPPPLPSQVETLRIIGDLDWTCIAPLLPICSTLVVCAPLPLVQSSIYTPRLATPRGLTDSHACAAYLARCPRLVLALPTALRGTNVYVLTDLILSRGCAVREIVLVAEEGAEERGEWREGIAALCCLLGSVLLNRTDPDEEGLEPRFTLVNVLEAGAAWRQRQADTAADRAAAAEWGRDAFWHHGMGLFRLAGHEFAREDEEVRWRMERSVDFLTLGEYEARVGTEACRITAMTA